MEHSKHIIRFVLLLVVAFVGFIVVRHFAVPESYGMHGAYRFDSVAEYMLQTPLHGASGACARCHEDQAGTHSRGAHQPVSCEVCHAPLGVHVKADKRIATMPVHEVVELCGWCHSRLAPRPKEFPQVVLSDHVTENGEEMSKGVCLECHNAHDPAG